MTGEIILEFGGKSLFYQMSFFTATRSLRLVKGGMIEEHYDAAPSFAVGHRIHVPLCTNADVTFTIDGDPYKLEVGKAYELNNLVDHGVVNEGVEDRYHLIFDYVPPQPQMTKV